MHTNRRLIVNTALMTGSSIVMRCIGLVFQAWIVGRIGAAGIGLYQLVMSVSVLFATFAISGIRFATTRLISEEMGLERGAGVTGAMRRCACYALFFGLCAGTMVYFLAEPVGFLWIGDARTVRSLRITSISLPCISLSSVMDGYFTASGRVWKPTLVHLIEQLVSITCVMWFLSFAAAGDLEQSCAAVTAGGACADVVSLLMMAAMYLLDRRLPARARPADALHGHQCARRHARRSARVGAAAAVRAGGVHLHFVFQRVRELHAQLHLAAARGAPQLQR